MLNLFQHPIFSQQLSKPLNEVSILSGADVKANGSQIIVNGNVVAAGKVDSSIIATDTVIQQTLCVTQRFLDSLNAQRQNLKSQTGTALPYAAIGDTSFTSGVYEISSSLTLSKTITLAGDSNSVFVFNISGDLLLAPNTQIVLVGGVKVENIFFNVDGKITVGDSAAICGNFLADGSIYCLHNISAANARLLSADTVSFESARDTVGVPAKSRIAVWGTTCECAVNLDSLVNICPNNFTMTGGEMWFSFTAEKSASRFVLIFPQDSITGQTYSLTIFSGSCDSLIEVISKDTVGNAPYLRLDVWDLVIGNIYYVKASRTIVSDSINISLCYFPCKTTSTISGPCSTSTAQSCANPPPPLPVCTGENVLITPTFQYSTLNCSPTLCTGSSPHTSWEITITNMTTGITSSYTISCNGTLQTSFPSTGIPGPPTIYCVTQIPLDANGNTCMSQCVHKNCNCFIVYESFNLSVNATPNPVCMGECVTLTATATDGSGNFGYLWTPGGQTTYTIVVCPSVTTTYSVTVTDFNIPYLACCSTKTAAVTVIVSPLPVANAGPDATICFGTCTTLNGSGGVIYSWSPSTGLSNSTIANPVACPSVTTTYTLTVTDANGCTGTDQVIITIAPLPVANAGPDVTYCIGQPCPTLNGSGGGTYSWSPATGLSCTNCSNPTACPTANTTYTLTVTDNFGCTNTDAVNVSVGTPPAVPVIAGNPNDCSNPTVYTITNYNSSLNYSWVITGGTIISGGCPTCSTATIQWSLPTNQSYVPPCPAACGWGVVSVTANNSLCASAPAQMPVFPCCPVATPSVIALNNTSVTLAASTYGPSVFAPSPGGYTVNTYTLAINGQFTIDVNLTLTNCDVSLATNSKILINSGKTLALITTSAGGKSTILHRCCDIMWDGIYIADNTAHLNTTSSGGLQTTIQEAQNAIVSNNGGDFFIDNTLLQNNNIDIIVNPYSGNHTGTIARSTLKSAGPMHPYVPIPGISCQNLFTQTYKGIEINRVANITIGNAGSLSYKNTFDRMDFGIRATVSKVQVYNNTFQNIFPSLSPLFGVGVYAEGGKFLSPPPMGLTVGGTGLQVNTFQNCQRGVKVQTWMPSITVKGNTFTDNRDFAVSVFQCGSNPLSITNNFINNTSVTGNLNNGIVCTNVFGSNTTISNNTIFQSAGSNLGSAGITVQNALLSSMTLNISNNTITNKRAGIWLVNVTGNTMQPQPLVNTNTVTINSPFSPTTVNYYGIRIQSCTGVHAKLNQIASNITPTSAMVSTLRGISLETPSPQCIIGSNNTINNMGSGIYVDGNVFPATLVCNNFNGCWHGMYFNNAATGDQLPFQVAQWNKWPSNASIFKMSGGMATATNFWYRNPFSPFPQNVTFLTVSTTTVTTNACPFYIVPPPPPNSHLATPPGQMRETNFGAIARNQRQFIQNPNEFRFADRQFAHRYFRRNPSMLNLGMPDDSVFVNFYNAENAGNLGAFENVRSAIEQNNIQQAININFAVNPNNIIESNRKTVNEIYLRTWADDIFEFTPADSSTLFNIAMQQPLLEGDAVYSARVMLGIDPATPGSQRGAEGFPMATQLLKEQGKIYPNPANNTATLEFWVNPEQKCKLEIYSILGEKMLDKVLKEGTSIHPFDTSRFPAGIYLYRVSADGNIKVIDKLAITK